MSRQELKDFIKAIERNYSLKKQVRNCKKLIEVISIAKQFGFNITMNDFEEDKLSSEINNWFKKSKISIIK